MVIAIAGLLLKDGELLTGQHHIDSMSRTRGLSIEGRSVPPSDTPPMRCPPEDHAGRSRRSRSQRKLCRADLAAAADFLRSIGAQVATIELGPGALRIVTTAGQMMKLDVDDAELDRELQEYRVTRAKGHD